MTAMQMPNTRKPTRLNFGCGDARREGFAGVDIRASRAADFVLAAWDTSPFEPASVEEIYSRHMLEHLDPNDARKTLEAWLKLLEPGGTLRLIVPDLTFHARQLLGQDVSWTDDQAENLEHAMAGFYGWRNESRGGDREDAHRWGYSWESLSALLRETGFVDVVRVMTGEDGEPWHLHVTAARRRGSEH